MYVHKVSCTGANKQTSNRHAFRNAEACMASKSQKNGVRRRKIQEFLYIPAPTLLYMLGVVRDEAASVSREIGPTVESALLSLAARDGKTKKRGPISQKKEKKKEIHRRRESKLWNARKRRDFKMQESVGGGSTMQKKNDEGMFSVARETQSHHALAGPESPPRIEQARGRRTLTTELTVERIDRGGSQVSCAAVFRSALSRPVLLFSRGACSCGSV